MNGEKPVTNYICAWLCSASFYFVLLLIYSEPFSLFWITCIRKQSAYLTVFNIHVEKFVSMVCYEASQWVHMKMFSLKIKHSQGYEEQRLQAHSKQNKH